VFNQITVGKLQGMGKSKSDNRFRSVGNNGLEQFENRSEGTRFIKGIKSTSRITFPIETHRFEESNKKRFTRPMDSEMVQTLIKEMIPEALTQKVTAKETDSTTVFTFFPSGGAHGMARKIKRRDFDAVSQLSPDDAVMRLVIGHDDRIPILETVYPYNTLCFLEIEREDTLSPIPATGFFISKRCIITAGHCVFAGNSWSRRAKVTPGAFGNRAPFGHAESTTFRSVEGWTNNKDSNFDYGAIILNDDTLFNKIQATLGFKPINEEVHVEIPGYPQDKNGFPWKCDGVITGKTKYKLLYEIDTENGNSGSPIISSANGEKNAVGLHTEGGTFNGGIRMRDKILDRWGEWIKL
jgi:V8-like Glu-specific endopeptidase